MTSSSPVSNSITISAIPWGSSPLPICNGLPSQLTSLLASSYMPLLSKARLPGLVYLERPQGRQGDQQGRHEERGEHVRHAHLLEPQEAEPKAEEQDAARRGHSQDRRLAHERPEHHPGEREAALDHEDRPGREQDAPPQHRGERERGHEVEGALEHEELVVARDA